MQKVNGASSPPSAAPPPCAPAAVLANASSPATGPLSFKIYIPGIDQNTGAFGAYYLIGKKGKKPAVTRVLGMGASTPDGVLLMVSRVSETVVGGTGKGRGLAAGQWCAPLMACR